MKQSFFYIPKRFLLLIAGIVWFGAGVNIIRIGVEAAHERWTILGMISSVAVFAIFFAFIFRRLIKKHTRRISGYGAQRMHVLRFFDGKSYLIMIFMMTLGILLRKAQLWPAGCIRIFYTGIGASLLAAGIGFCTSFATFKAEGGASDKRNGVWI